MMISLVLGLLGAAWAIFMSILALFAFNNHNFGNGWFYLILCIISLLSAVPWLLSWKHGVEPFWKRKR